MALYLWKESSHMRAVLSSYEVTLQVLSNDVETKRGGNQKIPLIPLTNHFSQGMRDVGNNSKSEKGWFVM